MKEHLISSEELLKEEARSDLFIGEGGILLEE